MEDELSEEAIKIQRKEEEREEKEAARLDQEFRQLLQQIMGAAKPEHIPGMLTRNLDLLLDLQQFPKVLYRIVEQAKEHEEQEVLDAVELVLSFWENFVDQAQVIDRHHKDLVGEIINKMLGKDEAALDQYFHDNKNKLTPGFLRHLEGECERIANAPKMTKESSRMLEMIYTIQVRVLEELGKDIGEGALVLGQLLGYDNEEERILVLEGGLRVRGYEFARHMRELTQEALEGFQTVQNVDEELVQRVSQIDGIIGEYLKSFSP